MTLASALTAHAQMTFTDAEMVLGRVIFMAFRPDVKAELKLTEAQYKKMLDAFGDSLQVDGERMSIMLTGGEDLNGMEKDALKVLDDGQRKRLHEVRTQFVGALIAADEKAGKELGLSEDQTKEVAKIIKSVADQLQDLFSGGHNEDSQKDAEAIRKKGSDKILGLFNEDQKKRFEAMKGKEFKLKERSKSNE